VYSSGSWLAVGHPLALGHFSPWRSQTMAAPRARSLLAAST
jgi:hypothetical protein